MLLFDINRKTNIYSFLENFSSSCSGGNGGHDIRHTTSYEPTHVQQASFRPAILGIYFSKRSLYKNI